VDETLLMLLPQANPEIGLPSRFNCQLFSEKYEILREGVRLGVPGYERVAELVNNPSSAASIIYDTECEGQRSETSVRIQAGLFAEMRDDLALLAPQLP